uniref:Uncharacterized protein n=1 Tax=Caenorhabditis japonica TaxID=281687 RepID=A0A8R1IEF3_CAEJA
MFCCFSEPKIRDHSVPIVLTEAPQRPGFKRAPEPPKDKGSSIVYENGCTKNDIPQGFYISDLGGNTSY